MFRKITIFGLVFALANVACTRKAKENSRSANAAYAQIVTSPDSLLTGPVASGAVGDFRLENSNIIAIIGQPSRSVGFSVSGGNLVDLAPAQKGGEDHLNQITLYLQNEFPRQANYTRVEIIQAGGLGQSAIVRASGKDTKNPAIKIETDYILHPQNNWLTLETRFTSSATHTISNYRPGDAIQWGRCQHLGPGAGFDLPGRRLKLAWLAALGAKTSYGLVENELRTIEVLSGSMWSDTVSTGQDIPPGQTIKHIRHVVVGQGDTASLMPAIFKLSRGRFGTISGKVQSKGKPVLDAKVEVRTANEKLFGIAKVNRKGAFEIQVPAGDYSLFATAPGRPGIQTSTVSRKVSVVEKQTVSRTFELGARTKLQWEIEGDAGRPQAVKLTILGLDGTPNPNFGPSYRADGARHVVLSAQGKGEIPLSIGKYRVIVSRGNEYELIEREITINLGTQTVIRGQLQRSVNTAGFVAAELHQHTAPSFDSGVSLEDRTISLAAEGIEVFTSSDHNVLIDFTSVIASTGLSSSLKAFIGTEATTHTVGHFNAFPLRRDEKDPRGGMVDPEHWAPQKIFDFVRGLAVTSSNSVIQINHPRAGYIGYFDLMKFDPDTGYAKDKRFSLDFDAIEVIAFGFEDETKQAIADWFALLKRGIRVTATGNSDSHTIYGRENGWPRNLICSDTDQPDQINVEHLMQALRRGCSTISAGPIVVIRTEDAQMGGLAKTNKKSANIMVTVQAPRWIPVDWLDLYVDGKRTKRIKIKGNKTMRYQKEHRIRCKKDCFVVAMAGSDRSLAPVVSTWRKRNPKPIAMTNPIFLDIDGDGQFMKGGAK